MTLKLKPEIKARWLKALRSGKIKQTNGVLRDGNNAMCCLGVLCNLHAEDHPKIAKAQECSTEYMGEAAFPPKKVLLWAFDGAKAGKFDGTYDTMGVMIPELNKTLATLNDDGKTFKQIAQIIERHL